MVKNSSEVAESNEEEIKMSITTVVGSNLEKDENLEMEKPQSNNNNNFDRGGIVRSTVARKCREFYIQRLQRTEKMQRRWSSPLETESEDSEGQLKVESDSDSSLNGHESNSDNEKNSSDNSSSSDSEKSDSGFKNCDDHGGSATDSLPGSENGSSPAPLRKWKSTFDLAMDNLRKEISSLVAQDNDLFKQLLSLNDSIAELRDQQRRSLELIQMDDEEDDDYSECSRSPSLESLSDPDTRSVTTTSPASTLSSSCSSSHHSCRRTQDKQINGNHRHHHHHYKCNDDSLTSRSRSSTATLCLRCRTNGKLTAAPLYKRRTLTHGDWRRDDFDSYDSGIHLHGSHSDSDHEIFV